MKEARSLVAGLGRTVTRAASGVLGAAGRIELVN
jgi:hypothetical protein